MDCEAQPLMLSSARLPVPMAAMRSFWSGAGSAARERLGATKAPKVARVEDLRN